MYILCIYIFINPTPGKSEASNIDEIIEELKHTKEAGTGGPEDFANKSFRELLSRGSERDYIVVPENMEYVLKGSLLKLKFYLPKGSYATELVRQLEEA